MGGWYCDSVATAIRQLCARTAASYDRCRPQRTYDRRIPTIPTNPTIPDPISPSVRPPSAHGSGGTVQLSQFCRDEQFGGRPLKQVRERDDAPIMDVWFQHIASLFVRDDADARQVQQVLKAAAERSALVGFGSIDSESCPKPDHGSIEAVEGKSLLILTPRSGGKRFVVGEHVLLCVAAPSGFDLGEVKVLGTWEVHDGGIHRGGIRVSIPQTLEHVQRREHHRLPVAFDLSPRALLHSGDPGSPVGTGEILDISESGARLRVRAIQPIETGSQVEMHASFPASFPSFTVGIEVVHVAHTRDDDHLVLGVRFLAGIPALGKAIHQLEIRRAQRLRK